MKLPDIINAAVRAGPIGDHSQLASVTAVGAGVVEVSVPTGVIPDVRHLAHYSPVIGDLVVLTTTAAGDRFVPGRLAS